MTPFKQIRVFPRRTKWTPTDEMAFVGDPPLWKLPSDTVMVSCVFTWDLDESLRLKRAWEQYYHYVYIGGPALDDRATLDFEPGQFIKKGVTITSRGCPFNCDYCLVPKREGKIRELPIKPGHIIQDNNLLACSRQHIEGVFNMLREQSKAAIFAGGLDKRLLESWHIELFESIKIKELWFACDTKVSAAMYRIANLLEGFPQRKKRCYVLIGRGDIKKDEKRLEQVYQLGFDPFAQLYQPPLRQRLKYSKEWRNLARKWARPAAHRKAT